MQLLKLIRYIVLVALVTMAAGCDRNSWNNPYPNGKQDTNVRYAVFAERPKTLDPARSYNVNEAAFTTQIYEPPLQYDYLKRPYSLIPLASAAIPTHRYYDKHDRPLPANAAHNKIAYTIYTIKIKPDISYQPHPAFATRRSGLYRYHLLTDKKLKTINTISNFRLTDTRELTAQDYVYQIKRLADPKLTSPIFGLMSKHIAGLHDYAKTLKAKYQAMGGQQYIDLRELPLPGTKAIDKYTYQIKINAAYPQFIYWLAMPFFSPMPWEADKFYSQPGLKKKNISLDWYPVGTGPYMLTENNPNKRMVLSRNPNFHSETYPAEGNPKLANKLIPFIDKHVFSLEKESIPLWSKFLQGYYDQAGVGNNSFDQAIRVTEDGEVELTKAFKERNIQLRTAISPTIFYMGFNMLDKIVGGYSERARKLRQAISLAVNFEEFISIFLNGSGVPAQGPIPPEIFGHLPGEAGINPYMYTWQHKRAKRKNLALAKKFLSEAGYPNGRNAKTGKPLVLNYDVTATSGPDDKARLDWYRKQFAKLGIQLHVRATQYNRFQQKMRTGHAQIFSWGWQADYPDPENFLFLLLGSNSKVKHNGENAANYENKTYDVLFEKMKKLPNGPARQQVIDKMLDIVRRDAPLVWGFHPRTYQLMHGWLSLEKPHAFASNTLKYIALDPKARTKQRKLWNPPILWPLFFAGGLLFFGIAPVVTRYRRSQHSPTITKVE